MTLNMNLADTMLAGRGGFVRRVGVVAKERRESPDLLLFDSGDFSQGSSYYTLFKGDVEVGLMNMMHYDAATIGNHEFDFSDSPLKDIVKPYVVIVRNGVKIGVLGLGPKLSGLVFESNYKGVKYLDPAPVAEKVSAYLKNELKCDVVICLSHLGWSEDECDDKYMISHTRNIDLVLGGHSHSYFTNLRYEKNEDGLYIPDDQNCNHTAFIDKIKLQFKKRYSK